MSSDTVRNQILEAAGPVFAERGFKGATVRDICKAADVNLAAVNYYFGDKSQLYFATVQQAHRLRAADVPMPGWDPDDPPQVKLLGFIRTILERMIGETPTPWPVRLMLREILSPTEACRSLVKDYFRPQFELLLSIVDEFVATDTSDHQRHQIAFSVIGQCFFYRTAGEVVPMMITKKELKSHYSVDKLAQHVCDMSLPALTSFQSKSHSAARRQ
jgi:AcrR family transcriptional regulator